MLNSISACNFKSFKDFHIELRPITVFLGVNGAGKSSILKFLRMLDQTAQIGISDTDTKLRLNGEAVELGEAKKVLFNMDKNKYLSFKVHLSSYGDNIFHEALEGLRAHILYHIERLGYYARIAKIDTTNKERILFPTLGQRTNEFKVEELVQEFLKVREEIFRHVRHSNLSRIQDADLTPFDIRWNSRNFRRRGAGAWRSLVRSEDIAESDVRFVLRVIEEIRKLKAEPLSVEFVFSLSADERNLDLKKISIKSDARELLGIEIEELSVKSLFGDILPVKTPIEGQLEYLSKAISKKKNLFNFLEPEKIDKGLAALFIMNIFTSAVDEVESNILQSDFRHIPPIRTLSDRYVFSYRGGAIGRGLTSSEDIFETLSKDEKIKDRADAWFKKFNISFNVKEVTELLRELVALRPFNEDSRRDALELSILDVGFGYSQILPVIIESLRAPEKSTVIIEQPEVHLHPRMQADLADFFIETAGLNQGIASPASPSVRRGKRFIIETHSENFMKRLRRRMAEKTLRVNDVAIYFVEGDAQPGDSEVRRVTIQHDGQIEWPRAFYETDLEDTRAFFRNL